MTKGLQDILRNTTRSLVSLRGQRLFVLAFLGLSLLAGPAFAQQSNPFLRDFQPKEATIPAYEDYAKPEETATVTVHVDAQDTLARIPAYLYGNNLNPYIGAIHTDQQLIDYVKQLSPNVLRMPGGNLSNVFFWDASPGSLPPGVPDSLIDGNSGEKYEFSPWYGKDSWSLGLDGFYEFINKTNSEPIISVNYSYARYGKTEHPVQQAAHYAAEWVRYDNGRTKFWEIGNENGGSWQAGYLIDTATNLDGQPRQISGSLYGQHIKVFIDSMKAAAAEIGSEIYIGAQVNVQEPASWDPVAVSWNSGYFGEAGNAADFFIEHNYYTPYEQDSEPYVIFNSVDEQLGNVAAYYPDRIEALEAEAKPIALTEWNIFAEGSRQMVSNVSGMHAAMVLGRLSQLPYYGLATRWDLANGYNNGNDHGLFKAEDSGSPPVGVPRWNPRPAYFHMYYFQQVFGDHAVKASTGEAGDVVAYASIFSSGEAGVVLVNTGTSRQIVSLDMGTFNTGERYYYYSLVGGTDNPPYSAQVYVNGVAPDYSTGGPISRLGEIKARSASTAGGIRLALPPHAAQYVLIGSAGTAIDDSERPDQPTRFELKPNYPNPFNPSTQIRYSLREPVHVTLAVYNVLGQKVATLVNRVQSAGNYEVTWEGTTGRGSEVSSGVYLYRIDAGPYTKVRKMTLMR